VIHPHAFCDMLLTSLPAGFSAPIAILRNWSFALFYVRARAGGGWGGGGGGGGGSARARAARAREPPQGGVGPTNPPARMPLIHPRAQTPAKSPNL
jgi:hypothetical protein